MTYWRGRGRAEPLRNIIAGAHSPLLGCWFFPVNGIVNEIQLRDCVVPAGGETFENSFIGGRKEMLELVETKKLAYDQVPLVEVTPQLTLQSHHS